MAGYRGMLGFAWPGVIVHEGSHYALCHAFLHKVISVRFFETNPVSGSFGYVEHSYNPHNFYHQLGNFFIGMAPLFGGTLAIYFLVNYFLSSGLTNPFEPSESYHFNMATTLFDNIPTNIDFFINTTISIMSGLWSIAIILYIFNSSSCCTKSIRLTWCCERWRSDRFVGVYTEFDRSVFF